jgi:hypothetical protein
VGDRRTVYVPYEVSSISGVIGSLPGVYGRTPGGGMARGGGLLRPAVRATGVGAGAGAGGGLRSRGGGAPAGDAFPDLS